MTPPSRLARLALALAFISNFGTIVEASTLPGNLKLLEGKHVVVGRILLCMPKTYAVDLSYAGKTATVISFKRNIKLDNINTIMTRLPENTRQMFTDLQRGGILSLKFEDGKVYDTCGDIGFAAISANVDLAPGETIADTTEAVAVTNATLSTSTSHPQECPVVIVSASSGTSFGHMLLDAATTSEFDRQADRSAHGGTDKHYLDIKVQNDSHKAIKAYEFAAVYSNKMGDSTTSTTYISQNEKAISPGTFSKSSAMDRTQVVQNGAGEIKLFISRIRFNDDTSWSDDGTHSCSRSTVFR